MSSRLRRMAFTSILPRGESSSLAEGKSSGVCALEAEQPTLPLPQIFQEPGQVSKPVVVIVDDSLTVRTILEICLQREGFEVQTFGNGLAFLRWLTALHADLPALLLLDVMLPHLDGYTLARYLGTRPAFQQIPIVFLSSKDGVLDRLKGRLLGASGYLIKPFRTQEIIAMIHTTVHRATKRRLE